MDKWINLLTVEYSEVLRSTEVICKNYRKCPSACANRINLLSDVTTSKTFRTYNKFIKVSEERQTRIFCSHFMCKFYYFVTLIRISCHWILPKRYCQIPRFDVGVFKVQLQCDSTFTKNLREKQCLVFQLVLGFSTGTV